MPALSILVPVLRSGYTKSSTSATSRIVNRHFSDSWTGERNFPSRRGAVARKIDRNRPVRCQTVGAPGLQRWNSADIPGAIVDGLPVGLSIVGGRATLVAVAAALTRM
jgi:hypothetical protein